jgi:hypothetical protein
VGREAPEEQSASVVIRSKSRQCLIALQWGVNPMLIWRNFPPASRRHCPPAPPSLPPKNYHPSTHPTGHKCPFWVSVLALEAGGSWGQTEEMQPA